MINRFKAFIAKFKKPSQLEQVTIMNYNQLQNTNDNLIAIARLSLIKPEVLVREARNIQSNAEYLLKMVEAQKEIQNDKNA
jgi:hypothetical protein